MAVLIQKPNQTVVGYNDEKFESQQEAVECAEWLENENGGTLYVFEKDGQWVVAWC